MARKSLVSSVPRPGQTLNDEVLELTNCPPSVTAVALPSNASNTRNLSFEKYYGNGCDALVYATQQVLEHMVSSCIESGGKKLSTATIATYFKSGCSVFLPYCAVMATALGRELRLDDLDRQFIDHYVAHLRQSGKKIVTQKAFYQATKSVLVAMTQKGWIEQDIFPRNPFPNSNRSIEGQTSLSEPERRKVLQALKIDMQKIVEGDGPLTSTDLSVCLLAVSARTGINPTPALELLTDCLQPHPIKADRYVLVSFKRRGNTTHIQSLRGTNDIESMVSALPDVARIINLVKERNASIRKGSDFPRTLFVYKSRASSNANAITRLSLQIFAHLIKEFVFRHGLTDDDNRPLRLNMMRLRKTFENRLFSLSGQDPFLTARLGGHAPKVSNDHYLEAPQSAERDWRLMGEVRTEELLNRGNITPIPTESTPVARCRDTLNGELAPKNGEHCQKFLACFRCRSFVVTSDDLHRAFSLYWMLVRMRESMGSDAWKRAYGHIIRIIDKEIAPKFDAELVALQRQRAKAEPHPFWRDPDLLEGAA